MYVCKYDACMYVCMYVYIRAHIGTYTHTQKWKNLCLANRALHFNLPFPFNFKYSVPVIIFPPPAADLWKGNVFQNTNYFIRVSA